MALECDGSKFIAFTFDERKQWKKIKKNYWTDSHLMCDMNWFTNIFTVFSKEIVWLIDSSSASFNNDSSPHHQEIIMNGGKMRS